MAADGLMGIPSRHGPKDTMNRLEAEVTVKRAPNVSASPDAAQSSIGHTNSRMACVSYAPGLILAAPYAAARHTAAMPVRAAAA